MLKLLSRSIRNDSESLAADLTKLQSVSPYWYSQHTMPQASPSDTQQYFILGRCRVVGFMFHILNERSRKLWWSTAALNRQWGHSRCVARLRSWDASIVQHLTTSALKSSIRRFVITEKAPTRAFSWLKAILPLSHLRHYAKRTLTQR